MLTNQIMQTKLSTQKHLWIHAMNNLLIILNCKCLYPYNASIMYNIQYFHLNNSENVNQRVLTCHYSIIHYCNITVLDIMKVNANQKLNVNV